MSVQDLVKSFYASRAAIFAFFAMEDHHYPIATEYEMKWQIRKGENDAWDELYDVEDQASYGSVVAGASRHISGGAILVNVNMGDEWESLILLMENEVTT